MSKEIFNASKSKIKLLVYMHSGLPKTYYSILKEDKKGIQFSYQMMKRRLLENKLKGQFQTAIFYDNFNKNELIKINQHGQVL